MNNKQILEEFQTLVERLSKPAGIRKMINNVSVWLSLNITIFIQFLGLQKSVIRKYQDRLILNIGSGDEFPDECVNTDLFPGLGAIFRIITKQEKIKYDYFLNVLHKDVNLVGKVDGIVFSHVLEHLPPHLSLAVLDNLRGFLKKDGILRISVPSLDAYENTIVPPDQNITTPILAKNSLFYRWNHKFMYNQELLTVLLESVGFSNVRITDCGLDELGEFDVKRRRDETLYLICTAN